MTASSTGPVTKKRGLGYWLWRLFAVVALIGFIVVLAIVPAFLFAPVPPEGTPEWLVHWAFDVRLALGPVFHALSSIRQGDVFNNEIYDPDPGREIRFESDGLTIEGTIYDPPQGEVEASPPAILLLHGSTPQGRSMGIYRVLGNELAEQGYLVLAIDQRGYGGSDDPPTTTSPEDFDYVADASQAITYLLEEETVDPDRIFVVGHSFGGDVALSVAAVDTRISAVVAKGPARRLTDRAEEELDYFRRRDMRYMRLGNEIPGEVFMAYREPLVIESHVDYYATDNHVPLLIIDGALEAEDDQVFLAGLVEEIEHGKDDTQLEYVSLADADHYANIADVGPFIFYEPPVLDALVEIIDRWLERVEEAEVN